MVDGSEVTLVSSKVEEVTPSLVVVAPVVGVVVLAAVPSVVALCVGIEVCTEEIGTEEAGVEVGAVEATEVSAEEVGSEKTCDEVSVSILLIVLSAFDPVVAAVVVCCAVASG